MKYAIAFSFSPPHGEMRKVRILSDSVGGGDPFHATKKIVEKVFCLSSPPFASRAAFRKLQLSLNAAMNFSCSCPVG